MFSEVNIEPIFGYFILFVVKTQFSVVYRNCCFYENIPLLITVIMLNYRLVVVIIEFLLVLTCIFNAKM